MWALVAPRLVESSWPRDQTHVPCTGEWILIYSNIREVPPNQTFSPISEIQETKQVVCSPRLCF